MPREVEKEVAALLAVYFSNYAGAIAPESASISGHLRRVLLESTYETIEPLVISVAKDGMILTRNSLLVAKNKRDASAVKDKPTRTPPAYEEPKYHGAIPMPAYVREALNEALRKNRDNL